jgi:hypothetical protein
VLAHHSAFEAGPALGQFTLRGGRRR